MIEKLISEKSLENNELILKIGNQNNNINSLEKLIDNLKNELNLQKIENKNKIEEKNEIIEQLEIQIEN
jgi:hypothetical protein